MQEKSIKNINEINNMSDEDLEKGFLEVDVKALGIDLNDESLYMTSKELEDELVKRRRMNFRK
jgi:hypothetical protein